MKNVKNICIFIGLVFISNLCKLEILFKTSPQYVTWNQWLFIGVDFVVWVALILFYSRVYKDQLENENSRGFGFKLGGKKEAQYFLLAGLAILFIQWLSSYKSISTNQIVINDMFRLFPILAGFSTILFAPVLEEFLFRGIFFNLFFIKNDEHDKKMAIFVSGILYGLAQEQALTIHLLTYSAIGWIFGILYEKTKSLYYPVALHMLVNAIKIL